MSPKLPYTAKPKFQTVNPDGKMVVHRSREKTFQEILEMQGVPMYSDTLDAAGVKLLFDPCCVSAAALRRLSGNSFNQACVTAFMAFVYSFIRESPASPVTG